MTLASYVLGFVLSSMIGFGFHVWKGGRLSKILLYLILGWVGFWGAQILGASLNWEFLAVGKLLVGLDIVGAIIILLLGHWLSLVNQDEE